MGSLDAKDTLTLINEEVVADNATEVTVRVLRFKWVETPDPVRGYIEYDVLQVIGKDHAWDDIVCKGPGSLDTGDADNSDSDGEDFGQSWQERRARRQRRAAAARVSAISAAPIGDAATEGIGHFIGDQFGVIYVDDNDGSKMDAHDADFTLEGALEDILLEAAALNGEDDLSQGPEEIDFEAAERRRQAKEKNKLDVKGFDISDDSDCNEDGDGTEDSGLDSLDFEFLDDMPLPDSLCPRE